MVPFGVWNAVLYDMNQHKIACVATPRISTRHRGGQLCLSLVKQPPAGETKTSRGSRRRSSRGDLADIIRLSQWWQERGGDNTEPWPGYVRPARCHTGPTHWVIQTVSCLHYLHKLKTSTTKAVAKFPSQPLETVEVVVVVVSHSFLPRWEPTNKNLIIS